MSRPADTDPLERRVVRIFRLNDFDWWAGYDLESVTSAYLKEMGHEDLLDLLDEPRELTDDEMDRLKFVDGDEPINADGTLGGERSFRQQLQLMTTAFSAQFPCFFASTEY